MEDPNINAIAELFGIAAEEPKGSDKVGRNADESRRLGENALAEGRYSDSLAHFRRQLEQNPKDPKQAMLDLAEAFAYGDDEPQALKQYRKAQKSFGGGGEAGVAELYRRYGRFSEAAEELRAAAAREPENPLYRHKLAETLRDAGFPRAALEQAQARVAIQPDSSHAHFAVAELQLKLKEWQSAIDSYRAALELSPGDDYLYLRTAVAFVRAGRMVEAIKAVRLASDLEPEKAVYHGLLLELLRETGDRDGAELERDRAEEMDRYDRDTLSRTLKEMGL